MAKHHVMLILLCVCANAMAENKKQFIPFSVECSIFANNFNGLKDINNFKNKIVTLSGKNSEKNGHQIVEKKGNYEFWVVAGETLSNKNRIEIFTYNAEIRNTKSGVTSQARSDENIKSSMATIKRADVGLVGYSSKNLLETSVLKMTCMHHLGNKEEALTLTH